MRTVSQKGGLSDSGGFNVQSYSTVSDQVEWDQEKKCPEQYLSCGFRWETGETGHFPTAFRDMRPNQRHTVWELGSQ